MKTTRNLAKQIFSLILCFAMMMTFLTQMSFGSVAADFSYKGGAGVKVVDLDTSTKYSLSLGDNASTEYAGRIWSDKSVYSDDVTFSVFGGGTSTIKLNENRNGEDFLVAFSALSTTESVSGEFSAPVDVVFIIDISGSMSNSNSNMDNGLSRIANAVQAANTAIEELMALSKYNRVSVVVFGDSAEVLLPLDHYTKATQYGQPTNFLSLNRETGSDYATTTLYAKGNNSSYTVSASVSVSGGGNMQTGLYAGMNVLASEEETTVTINGDPVRRVPSVVILSDGAPTYSSNASSWWAPEDNNDDGPGGDPYPGNAMKAILVASYMKDAIDRNYGVTSEAFATTVYTIGMGISDLDTDSRNLAQMTLDPGANWNTSSTNSMKTAIKNYWTSYTANNNTGTLNINVGTQSFFGTTDKNYTLTHPTTGYDVDPETGYDYVDAYYDADNASAITYVFDGIVDNIAFSVPQVPTQVSGSDPLESGFISYTDPIGHYMEVKDVKAIIYAGHTFTQKSVSTTGDVTTYTFSGTVSGPVYGDHDVANIQITVTDADGKQTLSVKIPAALIPLRVNEVVLNADGSVKSHTNNGAMPVRIIYSVGLQSEVVKDAANGTVSVDPSKISAEYLAANTNADGTINFYANEYTNMHLINGHSVGDAMVEFEPSHTNKFYYILEDMPIYKDAGFTQQVTAAEGLDDDTVYYYKDEYYHGDSVEAVAVARTGAQLLRTEVKNVGGYLYRAEGTPRLNKILEFEGVKTANATGTAQDFYAPEFHLAEGSTSAYDGKFIVHLGNNGTVTLSAGGNLQITKVVNATEGSAPANASFEFTVELDGSNEHSGSYSYVITNAEGVAVGNGTLSSANKKLNLMNGQTATVFGLPPQTAYVVTETQKTGYTSQSTGATGTISAGQTSVVTFVNTYNAEPVIWNASDITIVKELVGRQWTANDSFTFFIDPYASEPLPEGYNTQSGLTVTAPDTVGGQIATLDFGSIKFTAPGVYSYTVYEKEPENNFALRGMSYSGALYSLSVTVVDNGGTLSVAAYEVTKLYNDAGQPVTNSGSNLTELRFVNTYAEQTVVIVPVAHKNYTDNSGKKPLTSGMFDFELKALGIVENGQIVDADISKVPMPENAVNGSVTVKNEGHNVTFPQVSFDLNDIPAAATSVTYRYQITEVIPSAPVNGMTYDDSVFTVDVVLTIDNNVLSASIIYPNGGDEVVFVNEYTPTPVVADINGSKTIVGRDMLAGEVFEFVLRANDATSALIQSGIISVPSATATVENAVNGVAAPFSFNDIEFKKAGTYVFNVSETRGTAPSVSYDDGIVVVTVVVDDTNDDGNLEVVSVTYSNGSTSADFTNVYTSSFSGTPVSLSGIKTLTGKTLLDGEFYFAVSEFFNGTAIDNKLVTHTADSVGVNGVYTGEIKFIDSAIYPAAGTYEYIITEQIPANKVGGTVYDESRFLFTVVVEDDDNGNLIVTSTKTEKENGSAWESVSEIVFNNTYTPAPTTVTFPVINKVLLGDRALPLQAGEFKFEISSASADGIVLPAATVVSNAADGTVTFDAITFTKAGTYSVSVKEIIPADADKVAGISYGDNVITAEYTVYDDRNGNLSVTLSQLVGGENIVNTYTAASAEVTVDITKTFIGRDNNEWFSTDTFDFTVKITDPATLAAIENGNIELTLDNGSTDTATYTVTSSAKSATVTVKVNKPGEYKFTVSEKNGDIANVIYDTSVKEIVIVATDDSRNAEIVVSVNGQDTDRATLNFVNEYIPPVVDPDPITLVVGYDGSLMKNLEGRPLEAGEFVFALLDGDNNEIATATNDKYGFFSFTLAPVTAGVYNYVLIEKDNGLDGITYDDAIYDVEVVVTNDGGILSYVVNYSLNGNALDEVVFNNVYSIKAADLTVTAEKKLVGRDLLAGEFIFVLKNENGTVIQTEANREDGSIVFEGITLAEIGTYTFTLSEVFGTVEHVTYDSTEYVLSVTVSDGGNGRLTASALTVTEKGQTEAVDAIIFENVYIAPEIPGGSDEPTDPNLPENPSTADAPILGLYFSLFFVSGGVLITLLKKRDGEN